MITSFFGLGYAPLASGTVGSLGGVFIFIALKDHPIFFLCGTVLIFLLGLKFSGEAEKVYGRKDPKEVVIDEVCGMMVALLFLPFKLWIVVTAFILFRIFDIVKPPPCRRLEKLPGSYGIMLDDVVAGIYANLIVQIIVNIQKSLH